MMLSITICAHHRFISVISECANRCPYFYDSLNCYSICHWTFVWCSSYSEVSALEEVCHMISLLSTPLYTMAVKLDLIWMNKIPQNWRWWTMLHMVQSIVDEFDDSKHDCFVILYVMINSCYFHEYINYAPFVTKRCYEQSCMSFLIIALHTTWNKHHS